MAFGADELAAINDLLLAEAASAPAGDASARAKFRQQFPGLSLTRCDASDMDSEKPYHVYPGLSLFLVDASDHCWRITSNPAHATGIVLARHKECP
jgi:hypothetical protein